MKKIILPFCIGLLMVGSSTAWASDRESNGWKVAKEKDGVTVLLREVDGSAIREFRGMVTMQTGVEQLVDLYFDAAQCSAWVPNCKTSETVEQISAIEWIIRTELNSPWPIKNRDYVLRISRSDDVETGATVLTFQDIRDFPEAGCCVRMSRFRGLWTFTPIEGGEEERVLVTYQNHFNPAGGFPARLVNAAVADMPLDTLTNMRNLVEDR